MGSVKSNVGHLENASGLVSIIKAVLMLERRFILPNANFDKPNDAIPLDRWNIKVPTALRPWPAGKRYVSVNNFGFGGSNAHAVLEGLPYSTADSRFVKGGLQSQFKLVVLTGYDESAVNRLAIQLGIYIEQHPEVFEKRIFSDIAYTLGERRSHFPWRMAFAVSNCSDLAGMLNGVQATPRRASKIPKLAFVYTGQGAQWPEMGKQLLESYSIFSDTMYATAAHLRSIGAQFDLVEELRKDKATSLVNQAHISQPICTAVQIGLTNLLRSWGIEPAAVVGHSSGEICAAYATGAVTMEAAMEAAYFRGQAALRMTSMYSYLQGSMLAVGDSPSAVKKMIKTLRLGSVSVACENSPSSVTVSGDQHEVDVLATELEAKAIFNRKLRVEVAYHSSHMLHVADEYMASIGNSLARHVHGVKFYSSLYGKQLTDLSYLGPTYWVDNLTRPVLFSTALKELCCTERPDIIIEVGPHSALEGPIKQILKDITESTPTTVSYVPTLLRNQNATISALQSVGNLFVNGCELKFDAINQSSNGSRPPSLVADFEPYPFTQHKYWYESRASKQHRLKPFPRHDLLGLLEDTYSDVDPSWRNNITSDAVPWLKDHRMQSLTTFPLAGYLCMAVEAASQRARLRGAQPEQIGGFRFREIQVAKAFILDDGSNYETHVTLSAYAEGTRSYSNEWDEFRISSWTASRGWLEHCRGLVAVAKPHTANAVCHSPSQDSKVRRSMMDTLRGKSVDLDRFYGELQQLGAGYSSVFTLRSASNLCAQNNYSSGNVFVPETKCLMPYSHETKSLLPTAFMDLFFQLTFAILGAGKQQMASLYMPSAIKEVFIDSSVPSIPGESLQVVAHTPQDAKSLGPIDFVIEAWNHARTEPVVKLNGFRMTPVRGDACETMIPRSLCYGLKWEPLCSYPRTSRHQVNGDAGHSPIQTNGQNGEPNGVNGHFDELINGSANNHCQAGNHQNGINNGYMNGNSHGTRHHKIQLPGYLDGTPIVLVTGNHPSSSLISSICNLIDLKTGMKPSVCSFSTLKTYPLTRYICLAELESPLLLEMRAEVFEKIKALLISSTSILWVTRGSYRFPEKPENNICQGLLRTVRSELNKPAASVDLDPHSDLSTGDTAQLILDALKHSLMMPDNGNPIDYEFAEQDGELVVPRIVDQEEMNISLFRDTQSSPPYLQKWEQPGRRLKIEVGTFGALDSLYWDDEELKPLRDEEIEIKVFATGMNFKDVVIAMGQVASPYLGVECSGIVSRTGAGVNSLELGDRVCAMSLGAYGTYARCLATSAAKIPAEMSFETAASIPVVYSTAYYGMIELARVQPGEKILIHAGSGGVGQAAIQLAQMMGAEVYTTVGSNDKKQLIMEKYDIADDHIFFSRDTSFAAHLMEATCGLGVDVVLNSLAGDLLRESWECLAPFGRFIEIGKRDITANTRLEMSKFEHNCSFQSVDLTLLADKRPKIMGKVLTAVMHLLSNRVVSPISPITAVNISEVESALRKLQSGKTTGKVVVRHNPTDQVKVGITFVYQHHLAN